MHEKILLEEQIKSELPPTKIKGLENVWCLYLNLKKSYILVNIVETQFDESVH